MVKRKYLAMGLILVSAFAVYFLFFVDWEARAVKKHLQALAKELEWSTGENELAVAHRIRRIQEGMAENCQVDIPSYGISRAVVRHDVPVYLMTARGYYKNLSVELEDLEIETLALPAAQAVATAYVKAIQSDGVRNDEVLVIRFRLQKVNKKWQVNEAGEVHVLEK